MLKRLALTNFRRHAALTVDFTKGLNALRGANEAGKTTIYEAITYAFFGTKGLKESLDLTVTYGKSDTTLKVELDFIINGIEYHLKRSKSGAEITHPVPCDPSCIQAFVTCTGQTSVTQFVEGLLGCTVDTAAKLMLANQDDLRGALSKGATEASRLIEGLANFDLIDTLLELAQEYLPSGNTSSIESRISDLQTLVTKKTQIDILPLQRKVDEEGVRLRAAELAAATAKDAMLEVDYTAAEKIVGNHTSISNTIEYKQDWLDTVEVLLQEVLPAPVDPEEMKSLAEKVATKKVEKSMLALYKVFQQSPIEPAWQGDLGSFLAELNNTTAEVGRLAELVQKSQLELRGLEAKMIREKTCAFCQKDLQNVPEVEKHNSALSVDIFGYEQNIRDYKQSWQKAVGYQTELRDIQRDHYQAEKIYAHMRDCVQLDYSTVPATAKWVGPISIDETDYEAILKELERRNRHYIESNTQRKMNLQRKADIEAELLALKKELSEALLKGAKQTIAEYFAKEKIFILEKSNAYDIQKSFDLANNELDKATAVLVEVEKATIATAKALEKAKAEFADMQVHNVLIKKLRNARPQIADKLWGIVLASVSHYFSQIRGTASIVTRTSSGFQVNGNSVAGLSGSTIDTLGLAIRIALVKTFLPNSRFMLLDEPGKGCDRDRETALIGTVASCDFSQILLITHSELVDSFAENLISLEN